jgi:hypothetical protein
MHPRIAPTFKRTSWNTFLPRDGPCLVDLVMLLQVSMYLGCNLPAFFPGSNSIEAYHSRLDDAMPLTINRVVDFFVGEDGYWSCVVSDKEL